MKLKFNVVLAMASGIAAGSASIAVGLRYRRWKQQLLLRLLSTSRLLETRQGTVEYRLEGNGPVVLFLHGSPGGYDQGIPMAQALDLNGFTLLSLSRPGYRRTPLSSGETPEAQADLYAATLDALNIPQVTVVAISGGGPSALQFARRYPQRCRGLLMLVALSQYYSEEDVYRLLPAARRLLRHLLNRLLVSDPFLYLLFNLSRRLPEEAKSSEFIKSLVMNPTHSAGYQNDMQQFAALKPSPLPGITLPTLIVHGTADVEVPFRQAQELAEAIPGAQLVVVEGGGHLSTLGNKKAVVAIKSFLQKLHARQDVGAKGEE
jgi:pimeloyl-ACP methyl ester carboxylesterase